MTTFITLCVVGYLLWTAAYLLYERHERRCMSGMNAGKGSAKARKRCPGK